MTISLSHFGTFNPLEVEIQIHIQNRTPIIRKYPNPILKVSIIGIPEDGIMTTMIGQETGLLRDGLRQEGRATQIDLNGKVKRTEPSDGEIAGHFLTIKLSFEHGQKIVHQVSKK